MAIQAEETGRARAWILLQVEVDRAREVAQGLYERLKDEGDESYVVIRADVVDYHYNLVIPVDAENADVLQDVYGQIREYTGAQESALVPVLEHIPFPPHLAQAYITAEEVAADPDAEEKGIKPGRQWWSPGENAWG